MYIKKLIGAVVQAFNIIENIKIKDIRFYDNIV